MESFWQINMGSDMHPYAELERQDDLKDEIREVISSFGLSGYDCVRRYGNGHINDTYLLEDTERGHGTKGQVPRYILQRINRSVFIHPEEVAENVWKITQYLQQAVRKGGGDPSREALTVLPEKDGKPYVRDRSGEVWRLSLFISGSMSYEIADTPELFAASGEAFGHFQYLLRDFDSSGLVETIPDFHNTPKRYQRFEEALRKDAAGRAAGVSEEIGEIRSRSAVCSILTDQIRSGTLRRGVTHNDTKLNNVLFDRDTGRPLCVIDLDTVMPGLAACDFGDSIRFGANHNLEDEPDLDRVEFDLHLYEAYARGFLKGSGAIFEEEELHSLAWGARVITLEQAIRFLTDYLEGDCYYHTDREGQNLDRARVQIKLLRGMEEQFGQMLAVLEHAGA